MFYLSYFLAALFVSESFLAGNYLFIKITVIPFKEIQIFSEGLNLSSSRAITLRMCLGFKYYTYTHVNTSTLFIPSLKSGQTNRYVTLFEDLHSGLK